MTGDEVGHGAQTAQGAEAAGLALDGLDDAVEGFGGGIGDAGAEVGDDAIAVGAQRGNQSAEYLGYGCAGPR